MRITLPLPHAKLSPNARGHWRTRATHIKRARESARHFVIQAMLLEQWPDGLSPTGYRLTFYWRDKRRRDDDNASSSCKAYRDGIADALGIDDHTLRFHGPPTMLVDRENPRVVIELFAAG